MPYWKTTWFAATASRSLKAQAIATPSGFSTYDVLLRPRGVVGQRHVPVVGRADHDAVDVRRGRRTSRQSAIGSQYLPP